MRTLGKAIAGTIVFFAKEFFRKLMSGRRSRREEEQQQVYYDRALIQQAKCLIAFKNMQRGMHTTYSIHTCGECIEEFCPRMYKDEFERYMLIKDSFDIQYGNIKNRSEE
jgi:hypothetical protein